MRNDGDVNVMTGHPWRIFGHTTIITGIFSECEGSHETRNGSAFMQWFNGEMKDGRMDGSSWWSSSSEAVDVWIKQKIRWKEGEEKFSSLSFYCKSSFSSRESFTWIQRMKLNSQMKPSPAPPHATYLWYLKGQQTSFSFSSKKRGIKSSELWL